MHTQKNQIKNFSIKHSTQYMWICYNCMWWYQHLDAFNRLRIMIVHYTLLSLYFNLSLSQSSSTARNGLKLLMQCEINCSVFNINTNVMTTKQLQKNSWCGTESKTILTNKSINSMINVLVANNFKSKYIDIINILNHLDWSATIPMNSFKIASYQNHFALLMKLIRILVSFICPSNFCY